jgi:hypothetical protein
MRNRFGSSLSLSLSLSLLARTLSIPLDDRMSSKHWARFLRKAQLAYEPSRGAAAVPAFLARLRAKSVAKAAPDLKVDVKLSTRRALAATAAPSDASSHGAESPPAQTSASAALGSISLEYVDGLRQDLDLSQMRLDDVFASIEMRNNELEMEALKRGRPW